MDEKYPINFAEFDLYFNVNFFDFSILNFIFY